MKKFLPLAITSGLVLPMAGYAVGLSGIKVYSALNQPLSAEIRLSDLGRIQLSDIRVQLASPAQFSTIGIQPSDEVSQMEFTVTYNKNAVPVIRVTSREPMTDPNLQFAVSVHWPDGNFLRAYTLLLDPIDYKLSVSPTAYTSKTRYDHIEPAHPRVSAEDKQTIYGPVHKNEDLWNIALRFRQSASIAQAMVAIVRANPESFIRGNMNGLKTGKELVIPAVAQMKNISNATARDIIRQHQQAWHKGETIYYTKKTQTKAIAEATSVKEEKRAYHVNVDDMRVIDEPESLAKTSVIPNESELKISVNQNTKPEIDPLTLRAMQAQAEGELESTQMSEAPTEQAPKKAAEDGKMTRIAEAEDPEKQVLKDEVEDLSRQNAELKQTIQKQEHDFKVLREEMMQFAQHLQQKVANDSMPVNTKLSMATQTLATTQVSQTPSAAQAASISPDESNLLWEFVIALFVLTAGGVAFLWFTPVGRRLLAKRLSFDELGERLKEIDIEAQIEKVKSVDVADWVAKVREQVTGGAGHKDAAKQEKAEPVGVQPEPATAPSGPMEFVETPLPTAEIKKPKAEAEAEPQAHAPELDESAFAEIEKAIRVAPVEAPSSDAIEAIVQAGEQKQLSETEKAKIQIEETVPVSDAAKASVQTEENAQPSQATQASEVTATSQENQSEPEPVEEEVDHVIEFESGLGSGLSVGRKGERQDGSGAEIAVDHSDAAEQLKQAQAYIDKNDIASAMLVLEEVKLNGSAEQKAQAEKILQSLS